MVLQIIIKRPKPEEQPFDYNAFERGIYTSLVQQGVNPQTALTTAMQLTGESQQGLWDSPQQVVDYSGWLSKPGGVLSYQQAASQYAQTGQWPAFTNYGGPVSRGTGIDYGYSPGSWSPAPASAPSAGWSPAPSGGDTWKSPGAGLATTGAAAFGAGGAYQF